MNTTQNDIQEALDSFAEYYDTSENTVDSRKNLRYSLEGISCDLTKQFATELTRFCSVCLLSLLLCCRCSINSLRLSGKSNNWCSDVGATIDETEKQTRSLNAFHEDTKAYESNWRSE